MLIFHLLPLVFFLALLAGGVLATVGLGGYLVQAT
jgi:hypothetical protein